MGNASLSSPHRNASAWTFPFQQYHEISTVAEYLDTPGAGTHTYGVKVMHDKTSTRVMYFNKAAGSPQNGGASTLTVMEIG